MEIRGIICAIMTPDSSDERLEQIRISFLKNLGEKMVVDREGDPDVLINVYGTNLLINIAVSDAAEVTPDGYEYMRQQFVAFHTTEFTPTDLEAQNHLDQPELFNGFVSGLIKRGFVQVDTDPKTLIQTWHLTEQGQVEASLFKAYYTIDWLSNKRKKDPEALQEAYRQYMLAAEARYKFWKKKKAMTRYMHILI